MNFEWAVPAMKHGGRVRRDVWPDGDYWYFRYGEVWVHTAAGGLDALVGTIATSMLRSTGWELYKEPTPRSASDADYSALAVELSEARCQVDELTEKLAAQTQTAASQYAELVYLKKRLLRYPNESGPCESDPS